MSTSERDAEIKSSILRGLADTAAGCEQMAADYSADNDSQSATDLHEAALRYRQLAARAMSIWADADALEALTANSARSAAWDAETEACDAQETREIPRVH
ncbi:MAG TPA: hypothetical protein VGL02_01300 [Streptomyces sp.]